MPEEFVKVAQVGDLQPGEMKRVRMDRQRILLCNYEGNYYAVDETCTHELARLSRGEVIPVRGGMPLARGNLRC